MMKILLICTLSLIAGPVGCSDVKGYSGGSVIIISNLKWDSRHSKYVCKVGKEACRDLIHFNTKEDHVIVERFMLYSNTKGYMTVFIRQLKLQDAGTYRIGVETGKSTDVNLAVVNDSCCSGPKIINACLGQNTSIICNYPAVYERNSMHIIKLDNNSVIKHILNTQTKPQNGRFSVSDDRSAKVLSVNVSDMREADDGVYLCGVYIGEGSVLFYSFFTEIQLHIPAIHMMTSAAPKEIPSDAECFSFFVIIGVCVCVALLLIGGFALMIFKLRHKRTHDSTPSSTDNEEASSDYENDLDNLPPYENLNSVMRLNHQNLHSITSQSDSTYQTLDPRTNQADSGYTSLTYTTDQSYSHYQCLNPRTQTNSVYHTLYS
ncbi:CMRF35-like molecule 8 isoform X1 [Ictalurus furcatus]|uniref:CMRF35-like molecule 8 isoform X1 n=1 Tax=Ictalurus furcatus TaxID=66913 RepID=UPI0023505D75|nr:CMRF35-like molecule 8 isoform X1 [Ictalurus furcatus]